MDGTTFDHLVRNALTPTSRRRALLGIAGGMLGLAATRDGSNAATAGSVGAEGCRIERCKKSVLDQDCRGRDGRPDNHNCCQGLKCSNKKKRCVFKNGHGGAGDYCDIDRDCDVDYFCKKNQCIPNSCGS